MNLWFWNFNFENNTYQDIIERSSKSNIDINITSIPEIKNVKLTEKDFKSFLYEMEENDIKILPNCVNEILKSKACRGAIMFGDFLTKIECSNLIEKLSFCNFPFKCAHGRPSILPISNLSKIKI